MSISSTNQFVQTPGPLEPLDLTPPGPLYRMSRYRPGIEHAFYAKITEVGRLFRGRQGYVTLEERVAFLYDDNEEYRKVSLNFLSGDAHTQIDNARNRAEELDEILANNMAG
jgi:hypothetical protein